MTPHKFDIGDIVALLSHPYNENYQNIIISGDTLQYSPLMVVSEILLPTPSQEEFDQSDKIKYRCFWYSQRTQIFEDSWISQPFLKLISKVGDNSSSEIVIGSKALFKTAPLEVQKRKSNLTSEFSLKEGEKNILMVSPFLSFVSPILIISDRKNVSGETKEENSRKITDKSLLKVKWFNNPGDKVSEAIIPASCVTPVKSIDDNVILEIKKAIESKSYIKVKRGDFKTFIKPLSINYLNGSYYLNSVEFVKNDLEKFYDVSDLDLLKVMETPIRESAPDFDFSKSKGPIVSSSDLIKKAIRQKRVIRIKYMNQFGVESIRCLVDFKLQKGEEYGKEVRYLTGFCLTKLDERHFSIERIIWVQMLDLKQKDIDRS